MMGLHPAIGRAVYEADIIGRTRWTQAELYATDPDWLAEIALVWAADNERAADNKT